MKNSEKRYRGRLVAFVLAFVPTLCDAEELTSPLSFKAGLGIGAILARFNVSTKVTDKESGRSIFVDSTGTLGLPESDTVPVIYGSYRFSDKHAISFDYFRVTRESTFIDVDEIVGDYRVTGNAKVSDDTQFLSISYGYTLFKNDSSRVHGLVGVNGLDIKYVLETEGSITPINSAITSASTETTRASVPLPMLGVDMWYTFTPRWGLATRVKFIAGDVDDVKALAWKTNVNALYRFSKHVGGILGIAYFDAEVDIDESRESTEVNYGYDGLTLGLRLAF